MTAPAKRTRIGRNNNIATRQVVYRTPQGLEVDELDHFEIIRKRVFYEDVLLVTYHRQRSAGGVIVLAILFVILTVVAASVMKSVPVLAAILASAAGVALLFTVVRLLLQVDVITVFGRRSKAMVRYYYRKELARRTYNEICANVAAAQRSLARDIAATEPPEETAPVEEMPPMPEEGGEPTASSPPPAQ